MTTTTVEEQVLELFFDDPDWYNADGNVQRFKVDRSRRTLTGLILPWNTVAHNGFAKWRFQRGSVKFGDVGRVKLLRDHNPFNPVGVATDLVDKPDGLHGTVSVARGTAGDEVLSLAEDGVLDGFSAGPRVTADGWEFDSEDRDVRVVTDAKLAEVTVTAFPAFDDARVRSVQLMKVGNDMAGTTVEDQAGTKPTTLEDQNSGIERFKAELDERFDLVLKKQAESAESQAEQVAGVIASAFEAAFQRLESTDSQIQGAAAAARWKVVKEPPIYRFDGDVMKNSMVKDSWRWHRDGDYDARDRLRKFSDQQNDLVKLAQVTTTSAADVIPPGYRPDLFVTELMQGRPIVAQSSRGTITDATPFTVPRFVSATGDPSGQVVTDHTEGVNPTPGIINLEPVVVSPVAVSGAFELTREIVDSSNPAIDAIALAAMRESWNQQTEQKAYTALNGEAAVTEILPLTPVDADFVNTARDLLARYPFSRFAAPTGAVMGQRATRAFANAKESDTSNAPLLPSVGAQNRSGLGNAVSQGWFVDGLPFVPAWAVTEAVGDDLVIIVNSADWWTWESPLLTFRFEEKKGPANIELALFGYYATHVLRPAGIFAIEGAD